MENVNLAECVRFHGHLCGGVTLGYIMAKYAMEKMGVTEKDDLYCRIEFQNCMADGVQCVTGCTIGKRNLELHLTGKSAMTLVRADTGKGLRVTAKFNSPREGLSPREVSDLMIQTNPEEICHAEEAFLEVPVRKRGTMVFCSCCGEEFDKTYAYTMEDKIYCRTCAEKLQK